MFHASWLIRGSNARFRLLVDFRYASTTEAVERDRKLMRLTAPSNLTSLLYISEPFPWLKR